MDTTPCCSILMEQFSEDDPKTKHNREKDFWKLANRCGIHKAHEGVLDVNFGLSLRAPRRDYAELAGLKPRNTKKAIDSTDSRERFPLFNSFYLPSLFISCHIPNPHFFLLVIAVQEKNARWTQMSPMDWKIRLMMSLSKLVKS